ncbi:VRR-NUC domain-containing protein [Pseudomonas linyingensis]|uniref:VRR-NUC domain-containing protein n=1 Tax=Pseudomonas linyingensis TaxID=915471 RepID=A0A1H6ZVQ2_9PSED|nr:VRR-NUC domain-containing protein [Pseudomonas linyingensis]SEJ57549.1 VRR-NUC domain-containing protein [Pseudomonas linyingensis]
MKQFAVGTIRRRAPVDYEGNEQAALFNWMRLRHPLAWRLAYHVPNGGHRHKAVAAKLKAQGVKAGVPDITLALPRGGHHGLYIEFKATPPHDAEVAVSQKEWIGALVEQGYKAVICRGMKEAMAVIDDYLAQPVTEVVRG